MRTTTIVLLVVLARAPVLASQRLLLDSGRDAATWRVYIGSEYPGAQGEVPTCEDPERGQCLRASFTFTAEGPVGRVWCASREGVLGCGPSKARRSLVTTTFACGPS